MGEWVEEGVCKGMDKIHFYPPRKQRVSPVAVDACNDCPVKKECGEWAIAHETHGYWGGMTAGERSLIRAERRIFVDAPESRFSGSGRFIVQRRPACGTSGGYKAHINRGEEITRIEDGGCGCIEAHGEAVKRNRLKQKTALLLEGEAS